MAKREKRKNRFISLLMAIVMIVSMMPVNGLTVKAASTGAYNGTPVTPTKITSSNYTAFGLTESNWSSYNGWYGIRTAAEMYGFAALTKNDQRAKGVLLQDINLNEGTVTANGSSTGKTYNWTRIGESTGKPFLGEFDGNGCTISGLYCKYQGTKGVGLFGIVGKSGNIINVNIRNIVLANSYIYGSEYVGGIVGATQGYGANISNCVVSSDVMIVKDNNNTMPYLGGILGGFGYDLGTYRVCCTISNCVNLGKMQDLRTDFAGGTTAAQSKIGSITGSYQDGKNAYEFVQVSNCYYLSGQVTDKNGNNKDEKNNVVNWGLGAESGYRTSANCTILNSATASHKCVTVTHKEVKNTCKYPGCSEYTFCLVCGKITGGTKTTYAVDSNAHALSNKVTCLTGANCLLCGATFAKNSNIHASEEVTYRYVDSRSHYKYHTCCGASMGTESHTYATNSKDSCKLCGYFPSKPTEVTESNYKSLGLNQNYIGYYAISTAKELQWFAGLVNGTLYNTVQNQSAKAVLLKDIDMSGVSGYVPIGGTTGLYYKTEGDDKGYLGTFDGNGYVIKNLSVKGSDSTEGTYGVFGTLSGTVKHLGVEKFTFTLGSKDCRAGGIAGQMLSGSSVTDCYVANSTITATNKVAGGLSGCNYAGKISNSFTYKVSVDASRTGGIVGDNRGDGGDADRKGTVSDCYTDAGTIESSNKGNVVNSAASVSTFATGEIVYLLNNKSSEGVWKQTINKDAYPNFTGKTVYGIALTCSPNAKREYRNEDAPSPSHVFDESGICRLVDGEEHYQPAHWNEGENVYEISNVGQICWFAEQVKGGDTSINGKLMINIDASSAHSLGIGSNNNPYGGVFDGNGYTIEIGLESTNECAALFPYVAGATIKDMIVEGSIKTSGKYAATFVGKVKSGDVTIEKCLSKVEIDSSTRGDGTHGGFAGVVDGGNLRINNCGFTGGIISSNTNNCGGFVGWAGEKATTYINNSYIADSTTTISKGCNTFARNPKYVKVTNCYYLNAMGDVPSGATQKSAKAFANGEVTWCLNGKSTDGVWKQTIDVDDYPNFTGKPVYNLEDEYANARIVKIVGVAAVSEEYDALAHAGYTGIPTNENGYTGIYEVKYVGRNNTVYDSTEAPVNAGDYTVIISTDSKNTEYGGSVSLDFTIAKKKVTIINEQQKIAKDGVLSVDKVTVESGLLDGHKAKVIAGVKGEKCKYTATIEIKDADDNDVTANYDTSNEGVYHEYAWDTVTHEYRCINCGDLDNTDINMPTAKYQINKDGFKQFVNTITFGMFCKDYKTVEILYEDDNSGVKTAQYYISEKELSESKLQDVAWKDYKNSLSLDSAGTYFIYVKVGDYAGNTAVYNSEGIVIFEESTERVEIEYTRTTNKDATAEIAFRGNTVKEVKYGDEVLKKGTEYRVTDQGITFMADYLEGFAAQAVPYNFTVSYNAGGVEWTEDSYGVKPADTTIAVTVKREEAPITITSDISKEYDGTAVGIPTYTSESTGGVIYEYALAEASNPEFTTTAPKDAGTYVVRVTVEQDENYNEAFKEAEFIIAQAKVTVKADNKSIIYGEEDPVYTWTRTAGEVFGSDELNVNVSCTHDRDVDIYTILAEEEKDANPNYNITFETGNLTIVKRTVDIEWGDTSFTYDETPKLPTAVPTGMVYNDKLGFNIEGTKTNAGKYTATVTGITGEKAGNYQLPENVTIDFDIEKADQNAPEGLESRAETIDEKADGYIKNVTAFMEYRKDEEVTYTAIDGTELTNLADGTYYIRYKEDSNHNASPDTEIVLYDDTKLMVTVPEIQTGYAISVDKTELKWKESATLTYTRAAGYSELDYFAVKVNDEPITLDENGKYTIADVQENINVTVEGVADITAPTGEITLGTNKWNQFFNDITFNLFFKKTQNVTIKAEDVDTGSGLDKIYYHLATSGLTEEEVVALEDSSWTEYEDTFAINPQEEYIIYAKVVDKAGNIAYISSEQGIVVDTIVPVISGVEDGVIYYGNTTFIVTEAYINTVMLDGEEVTLTEGTYNIEADNKEHILLVTDKAGNETAVKFTVKKVTSLDDAIEDITEDNVKLEDKEDIREVLDKVNELIKTKKDFTEEEKAQLTEIKETTKTFLKIIAGTKKEATNIMVASQKVTVADNRLTVSWGKVNRADGYDIFVRSCDGKKFSKKPIKTIRKNKITTYTFSKVGGKKINAAKSYKVKVRAYQYKNGKKVYIGSTYMLHVTGKQSKKYTNPKKVTVNKTKVTLKPGKTTKIKAKVQKVNSKKKLLGHAAKVRYYSTKTKVATVDKNGCIKAVAVGTAKIYVMAENGKKAVVTVTVK